MMKQNLKNLPKVLLKIFFLVSCFPCLSPAYQPGPASPKNNPVLKNLQVEERTGEFIDLNLSFVNERGEGVQLSEYFQGQKPLLMTVIYYNCPNLCGLHLNGLFEAVKDLPEEFKKQFQFVAVSMDHKEAFPLARLKKQNYLQKYPFPAHQLHFLTGEEKNILSLTRQLGFRFRWDEAQKIFAHHPVAYILTPEGRISRYLYGVQFKAQTLKLSLVEATQNRIATVMDRILLFCFQFDPRQGRYAWYAYNIMRVGGGLSVFLIAGFLLPVWIRESKKRKTPSQRV